MLPTADNAPLRRGTTSIGEVASPCISVCTLLEPQGICVGCFRTLEEIAQWSVLDAAAKRAVLAMLPARRAELGFSETSNGTLTKGTLTKGTQTDAER